MLAFIFGGISPFEMLVVGVVAILLFGSKLPSVARSAGKSLTEFKRGMQDLQHEFSSAMNEAEKASTSAAEGTQARLPADTLHDDSLPDGAYDNYHGDPDEEEPEACDSEVARLEGEHQEGDQDEEHDNDQEAAEVPAEPEPTKADA